MATYQNLESGQKINIKLQEGSVRKKIKRLKKRLKGIRRRFRENYPIYPCQKFNEKRSLDIQLMRVGSSFASLESTVSELPTNDAKEIEELSLRIQILDEKENALLEGNNN
ncbi:hypothetical protein [Costertonia aggregata]|uniref:Uncharacterized protein n=1 Tax=Costertonia aggregata TaxID=343403 RepID=A0A7H9ASQ9_9FLAO|nr:hypothetical protein [Costertonia aggregata]QLG46480.1 hypothetical protein HYG79_14370 [Costertonia aggregata]